MRIEASVSCCVFILYLIAGSANCYDVSLSEGYIKMEINKWSNFTVHVDEQVHAKKIVIEVNHTSHISVSPKIVEVHLGNSSNWCHMFHIFALKPGVSRILFNLVNSSMGDEPKHLQIIVDITKMKSLEPYADWLRKYFYIFSILSVYPQIFMQFQRLSVVGLDMDYVCFNFIGHLSYAIYSFFMYTEMDIHNVYVERHPFEDFPVTLTENMYALHGLISSILLGIQAIKYYGVDKRVTMIGKELISFYGIVFTFSFLLAKFHVLQYLDFLYISRYIHIGSTMMKYVPQLYRNYIIKSTFGWSVWNSNLELMGFISLMSHLFITSYNYGNWMNLTTNTLFWMALVISLQHLAFIIQHYFVYKKRFEFDLSNLQEITLEEKITLYEQRLYPC